MKQSIVFKGIIRGTFSELQAGGYSDPAVITFKGTSLHDILDGLALPEWIFFLKVNGKRIKNAYEYIQRKGLDLSDYARKEYPELEVEV